MGSPHSLQSIYVIDRSDMAWLKVGISATPERRAVDLANTMGVRCCVQYSHCFEWECAQTGRLRGSPARHIEYFAHQMLSGARVHGEWFAVNMATVRRAIAMAAIAVKNGDRRPVVGRPSNPAPTRFWRRDVRTPTKSATISVRISARLLHTIQDEAAARRCSVPSLVRSWVGEHLKKMAALKAAAPIKKRQQREAQ